MITYSYDSNGNRKSVNGGGVSTTYRYDELNRMTDALSNVGATKYDYYKNGRLKTVTYPNRSTADYDYDASVRVGRSRTSTTVLWSASSSIRTTATATV